ncbi:probable DNA repair protein [Nitrosomonas sp. Nm51]|uniref:PD-(D/E)XK nuclease family protein n=1 Tax=Nitrosomonas sp. Nm51 TaxID=133720 RepID=UPI0008BF66C4|nr:PD-(D/E)XK nuclease family protein [Nitrosomonas sp. Nm51]SER41454.1 probable DNA repair protein [Nitrosomonas sp. Nm51]
MSDSFLFQHLSFHEFAQRLNGETAVGVTVVTPNRRLAQTLKYWFNRDQSHRRQSVWRSADILPFTVFLERIYQNAFYSPHSQEIPLLLTAMQAQALWQKIIQSSEAGGALLNTLQTARSAYEAWQLVHAWRLTPEWQTCFLNEDCTAFRTWMARYQSVLIESQYVDPVCLADLIANMLVQVPLDRPDYLYCYGFDVLTPQQRVFLDTLRASGCQVSCVSPPYFTDQILENNYIARVRCTNSQEEIYQAAVWARSRLESDQTVSIGVIVPALANYRNAIQRAFREVMQPDVRDALPQPQSLQKNQPFNISLGLPLTAYPVVDAALSVLALAQQGLTFDHVSSLLRSPFIKGGESEMHQRALLGMRMRQYAGPFVTLEQLTALVHLVSHETGSDVKDRKTRCPILMEVLSALLLFCQQNVPRESHHAAYAQLFSQILQIMGFPGERTLDSTEYQTVKKWQEVLVDFATLDRVIVSTSHAAAVGRLNAIAANTLFQPQSPHAPIQILGVLEAAGMVFDHLWVMGLSEEQWPVPARPNPFLPYELQKKARIPMGSTGEALRFSHQLHDNWLRSAKEVVLSHPRFADGADAREIAPSPIIRAVPECTVDVRQYASHRDWIVEAANLERIIDDHVQVSGLQAVPGGVAVIKDYAACPFRAWARHRLHVVDKDEPHAGLNARERGMLIHRTLHLIWRQLESKEALDTMPEADLEKILFSAAGRAIAEIKDWRPWALPERFMSIERVRLVRLTRKWLDIEKKRASFRVVATEKKSVLQIGELVLNVRLDRVDKLDSGQLLIIDYKTRPYSVASMLGERPDEPQLPVYLVMTESAESVVAGVSFASINPGKMGFAAIVNVPNILPGVKVFNKISTCAQFSSWDALAAKWELDLTRLANGFVSGDARVSPKNYPLTCQYCGMQPFCRIYERSGYAAEDQDSDHD